MATYIAGNKEIKLPFPGQKYKKYKDFIGESNEKSFGEIQINTVYKLMVNDFLKGEISVDDISSICNHLFDQAAKLNNKNKSELFDAVIAGSELGFYVRNPKLSAQFNTFLRKVIEYANDLVEVENSK